MTAYFPPDTGSASHLFYELGTSLAARGHEVTVLTSTPSYHVLGGISRYRGRLVKRETIHSIRVLRVYVPNLPPGIPMLRGLWQFCMAGVFFLASFLVRTPRVVLLYSPPLPLGLCALAFARLRKTRLVVNVQDLFPQSAIDLKVLRNPLLIRFFEAIERFIYQKVDRITVQSSGNKAHVVGKGAKPDKVVILPNWVDVDWVTPGEKDNEFSRENRLGGKFVVSFAGILGYSQDIDVIIGAADILRAEETIEFLIVGDGVQKERLQKRVKEKGLRNVRFLPMQPRSRYPLVLQASDVSLATLRSDVRTPTMPSKIGSIMSAGIPVVAAMRLDGDAPRLIREADCGIVLDPEDPQALAEAILRLYRDPSLCRKLGRNGRLYVEKNLSLRAATDAYEQLFQSVLRDART